MIIIEVSTILGIQCPLYHKYLFPNLSKMLLNICLLNAMPLHTFVTSKTNIISVIKK